MMVSLICAERGGLKKYHAMCSASNRIDYDLLLALLGLASAPRRELSQQTHLIGIALALAT